MQLVPASLDLLVVSLSALTLACSASKPPVSHPDAAASTNVLLDAGAAAGSGGARVAADSGTSSGPDAGSPPPAAAAGSRAGASQAGAAGAGSQGTAGRAASQPATQRAGTGGAPPPDRSSANNCARCAKYAAPMQTGTVEPSELSALSGLAMSRIRSDILYAHNDHDRPVVYALDLQGKLHARLTLAGAATSDIEDIAIGPCDATTCLYLADIGDNAQSRTQYSVLRFLEPDVPTAPGSSEITLDSTRYKQLHFTYADGSHNAESLLVGPDHNIYIFTKNAPGSGGNVAATGPSDVYRIDASAFEGSAVATATKLTSLPIPKSGEGALSAVAVSPCGDGFIARTYDRVYEFRNLGNTFEAVFAYPPEIVAMPNEPQSEGIDYRADGRGFVTSGEGRAAPIMLTACAP